MVGAEVGGSVGEQEGEAVGPFVLGEKEGIFVGMTLDGRKVVGVKVDWKVGSADGIVVDEALGE